MECLCLGIIIKILKQSCNRKITLRELCSKICLIYNIEESFSDSEASQLNTGQRDLASGITSSVKNMPFETVKNNFIKILEPLINENMKKSIISSLKDILIMDTTINVNEVMGYVGGYNKGEIIQNTTFDFAKTIVSFLYYVILKENNLKCKNSLKEISKTFVEERNNDERLIILENFNSSNTSPIDRTLNDCTFNGVFKEIYSESITDKGNPYQISIYCTSINNSLFDFVNLQRFIRYNLTRYILSRSDIEGLNTIEDYMSAGGNAVLEFINVCNETKENRLGELLLYFFMEQVLNAPKLLSKIEIDNITANSKSDGVYFYNFERNHLPFNQFIMGSSHIVGDLKSSVDLVFKKIKDIKENRGNELIMFNSLNNKKYFPENISSYLRRLLIPSKESELNSSPDMAFGCLIGYTAKLDVRSIDNATYHSELETQMKKDIKTIIPHINQLIKRLELSNYEFYFYVVPFNDADNERISIIDNVIRGN